MNQLREVLKEVLQEELKVALQRELAPVRTKLDGLDDRVNDLTDQVSSLAEQTSSLSERVNTLSDRVNTLSDQTSSLSDRVSSIQIQLDRMERSQTEDVVAMLRTIDKKITERTDRHEHQIELLNHRLLTVEADVRKLQLK